MQMDPLSFSTQFIKMYSEADACMSSATSFLYVYQDVYYLITNGHNITWVNPETNMRIIDSAAFPVQIKTEIRASFSTNLDQVGSSSIEVDLYEDDTHEKPRWYVHPVYGYKVDVIAIPWANNISLMKDMVFYPVNANDFQTSFTAEVADEVFILGYPLNLTGSFGLPIWKRGTISTEPTLNLDMLPKYLVDTATRPGMSGSPVIMQRKGLHRHGTEVSPHDIIGTIRNFAGVYSGRIGSSSEFEAQLGIVWKPEVIEEILNAKVVGDVGFQNI